MVRISNIQKLQPLTDPYEYECIVCCNPGNWGCDWGGNNVGWIYWNNCTGEAFPSWGGACPPAGWSPADGNFDMECNVPWDISCWSEFDCDCSTGDNGGGGNGGGGGPKTGDDPSGRQAETPPKFRRGRTIHNKSKKDMKRRRRR